MHEGTVHLMKDMNIKQLYSFYAASLKLIAPTVLEI